MPLVVALLLVGLKTLDRLKLESALAIAGAPALWRVARGRLLRIGTVALVVVAALAFSEAEVPALLGVHVYAEEFLSRIALDSDVATAARAGWPLMAGAFLCVGALAASSRWHASASGAVSPGWIGRWHSAPKRRSQMLQALALIAAALPLGLLSLCVFKTTGQWPSHAWWAVANSIGLAFISAAIACIWGLALARCASQTGAFMMTALRVLYLLLIMWPASLTGLAIAGTTLFDGSLVPAMLSNFGPLVLAHTLRVFPFAAWLMLEFEQSRSRDGLLQLQALGASRWGAWRYVHGPAYAPAILAAWVIGVGLSLAELTCTVLTVPPGVEPVILRLYNLMHYGDERGVMILALAQGATVALLMAAGLFWAARRDDRDR